MTNIYVGNISFQTSDADLEQLFAEYGRVDRANVVMDRQTGRSRGFGFVEMSNDAEAQKAIAELNGKELGGRTLTVNVARPRTDRPARGGMGSGRGGGGGGGGRY